MFRLFTTSVVRVLVRFKLNYYYVTMNHVVSKDKFYSLSIYV